jgi:opacity protein-like surface antigen
LKHILLLLSIVLAASPAALGQARGASFPLYAPLDLQVGASYSYCRCDYTPQNGQGFGFYSTLDLVNRFGAEVGFHQISISQHKPAYERTYDIGVRYHLNLGHHGQIRPYGKALYGRGVFNFPAQNGSQTSVGNLAYNMYVLGGGVDYSVSRTINVRAEVEFQSWFKRVGLEDGLTPTLFTIGAAYHFGGKGPP